MRRHLGHHQHPNTTNRRLSRGIGSSGPHDAQAVQFKDKVLQKIYDTKAKGVIIDLTAIDVLDSFVGRLISDIAAMARLMGTTVVITGFSLLWQLPWSSLVWSSMGSLPLSTWRRELRSCAG
ncbi:MAG: hypothetical protein KatS3mg057_0976 [Herpetosiphonaceae bacterium]|nr:MAG: hypothetical protein KatS3mg057_0976 [Herpetosiphonaceae bacterium]